MAEVVIFGRTGGRPNPDEIGHWHVVELVNNGKTDEASHFFGWRS